MGEAKRRKELGLTFKDRLSDMSPEVREVFDRFKDLRSGKYAKRSLTRNQTIQPINEIVAKYSVNKEAFSRMIFEPKRPKIDNEFRRLEDAIYAGGDTGQRTLLVTAKFTTMSLVYHNSNGHDVYPELCLTAGPWYLPDRAQEAVTRVLGEDTYQKWKKLVREDLNLLKEMVYSDELTWKGVSYSAISCYRSRLVCKFMDYEIHQGIAFFIRR